ncbi:MAG: hypothetical protein AAF927_08810 [Bacteroidota bacterium]
MVAFDTNSTSGDEHVELVSLPAHNYQSALNAYKRIAEYTSKAKKSIYFLDGGSLRRHVESLRFSKKVSRSVARQNFFKGIMAKIGLTEGLEYQAIFQVPKNESLRLILRSDIPLLDHAWNLSLLSNNDPNCSLRTCWPCSGQSFMIIDRLYLISLLDTDDTREGKYYLEAFEIRKDASGKSIIPYLNKFLNYRKRSKIITPELFYE